MATEAAAAGSAVGRATRWVPRPTKRSSFLARGYLAAQGLSGIGWWVGVYASADLRQMTLGTWNPGLLVAPDLVLFCVASLVAALTGRWIPGVVVAGWSATVTAALLISALDTRQGGWGVAAMTVATFGTAGATLVLRNGLIPTGWYFVGPFRFRPAGEHSGRVHLLHSLVQLVIFWTVLLGLLPILAAWLEHHLRVGAPWLDGQPLRTAGWVLFGTASCLGLWSCAVMATRGRGTPLPAATARELVADGPYARVRNPMAVAGVGQTIGIGLVFGSWVVIAAAIVGAALWDVFIRPAEEADLAARLGSDYEAYRRHVRRWFPYLQGHG